MGKPSLEVVKEESAPDVYKGVDWARIVEIGLVPPGITGPSMLSFPRISRRKGLAMRDIEWRPVEFGLEITYSIEGRKEIERMTIPWHSIASVHYQFTGLA